MKITKTQVAILAANLRLCRLRFFPGKGGKMRCAVALGLAPQRWYSWERRVNIPNPENLRKICEFFSVTQEWLLTNHNEPSLANESAQQSESPFPPFAQAFSQLVSPSQSDAGDVDSLSWRDAPPGSAASFFWLAHHMVRMLQLDGLRIDERSLDFLARLLSQPRDKCLDA